MPDRLEHQYLICLLDERYAIGVTGVVQIMEYPPVTKVPETPPYILGICNLRGRVVPVVDLRLRLHKPPADAGRRRCVVVTRFGELELGLVVDDVLDLTAIVPDQITPPPQVGGDYAHVFVKEIGVVDGNVYLILDENKVVNYSDLDFLSEEAQEKG